jgi:hypothetical protein
MRNGTVSVAPGQYLASWERESGSLFVPVFSEASLGDPVAIQVGLRGTDLRATLLGRVALVRRVGRPALPPGASILLDDDSRRAAGWLADAAAGRPVDYRARAPRFPVAIQLSIGGDAVRTVNVSDGGAALRWKAPLPSPGELVTVRLRDGLLAPTAEAVVAWVEPDAPGGPRVGVRIVAEGRAARAWARLAADAERDGRCRL